MKKIVFVILCLEGALLSFNVAATSALIPSIARDFSADQFVTGKIIWLYMIPYGIAAIAYGPLARIFEAKKIELVCFTLFSLANLGAGLSRSLFELYAARFFMGIFGASVIPLILILISHSADEKNRGKLVGLFFGSTFAASLVGLFLSGVLPWRAIFFIPSVAGFIVLIGMYFFLPPFKLTRTGPLIRYSSALRDKRIISVFSYIFLISFFYHGIQQWLGVYFSEICGLKQVVISMLITLTSLSGIFGEAVGGWFSDIAGRIKTVEAGISLMIISVFSIVAFKLPVSVLALVMIVWGIGWTFNHVGLTTILTDLPKEFVNEAASLNSGVRFIAGGSGALLSGFFMQKNFHLGFMMFGWGLILLAVMARKYLSVAFSPTSEVGRFRS